MWAIRTPSCSDGGCRRRLWDGDRSCHHRGTLTRKLSQVDLGSGPIDLYVSCRATGGTASTGTMTINFGPPGDPRRTWSSTKDLFFHVRAGSLSGPIVESLSDVLTSGSHDWRNQSNGDQLLIPGVNYFLDGTDDDEDFWPGELVPGLPGTPCATTTFTVLSRPAASSPIMSLAFCPVPTTYALLLAGATAFALWRISQRPRANASQSGSGHCPTDFLGQPLPRLPKGCGEKQLQTRIYSMQEHI